MAEQLWTVRYKLTKSDPERNTDIMAREADLAWRQFATFRLHHGIDDYHTAVAIDLRSSS